MAPKFKRGEQVEICGNEEGFENSYFSATIISEINDNNEYIVQFNTLLSEDEQNPLREFRTAADIRPFPPEVESRKFAVSDEVDAYAEDGWWKGVVVKAVHGCRGGRGGGTRSKYHVRFDRGHGEVEVGEYLVSCLRVHQDWGGDRWVCSKKTVLR